MKGAGVMSDEAPATSRGLKPRDIPKLGGSAAGKSSHAPNTNSEAHLKWSNSGFIVLIVVLCLIILVSLTTILFLLGQDKTTDEEKNQRPKASTYVTALDDEAGSGPSSWFRRTYLRLPFVRTASTDRVPSIKLPRPPSLGERPLTPSADDPSSESRDEFRLDVPQPRYLNRHSQLERLGLRSSISPGPSVRRLSTLTTSTCSVRFETSAIREIYPHERDRFAPSPAATLSHIHTQMSSPTSSLTSSPAISPRKSRVASQEIPDIDLPTSIRNSSINTSSSPVPPSFEGGTKFLEAL